MAHEEHDNSSKEDLNESEDEFEKLEHVNHAENEKHD